MKKTDRQNQTLNNKLSDSTTKVKENKRIKERKRQVPYGFDIKGLVVSSRSFLSLSMRDVHAKIHD